jgi:hypothetical protein
LLFVSVPVLVPLTTTDTPRSGVPASSETFPVTVPCCALARAPAKSIAINTVSTLFFIMRYTVFSEKVAARLSQ